jgi:hypothetical protein
MTYTKPEIMVLGDASRIIQSCTDKSQSGSDTSCGNQTPNSAYDLDE